MPTGTSPVGTVVGMSPPEPTAGNGSGKDAAVDDGEPQRYQPPGTAAPIRPGAASVEQSPNQASSVFTDNCT